MKEIVDVLGSILVVVRYVSIITVIVVFPTQTGIAVRIVMIDGRSCCLLTFYHYH